MQIMVRPLIAVLGALLTVGCIASPSPLLLPIDEPIDGASTVSVLSISTRAKSDAPGEIYSGERATEPSMTIVDVSIPPTHQRGELEWPVRGPSRPDREFSALDVTSSSVDDAVHWFKDYHSDGRVMIFVHGYNVHYGSAVYRLAQISHDLSTGAAPVLFTWPSRGTITSYIYDKESATYSRDALEDLLQTAIASAEVAEITILAHSMGTWLTMEALRQMVIRNGPLNPKIVDVILASPDIDAGVFAQQFETLGEERPYFTVLISRDDRALRLSRILGGNIDRLGSIDPTQELYANYLSTVKGVTLIDLSQLEDGGDMHHTKFAETDEALDAIADTLSDAERSESAESVFVGTVRSLLITLSETIESN